MLRLLNVTVTLLLAVTAARASPWWVSWNGDAFPETEGWSHYSTDPLAQRWLEDGRLFIDSRADWAINDIYGQLRPGEMTLGPSELLVIAWRIRVDEVVPSDSHDPAVFVRSDDQYEVSLNLRMDGIESFYEPDNWVAYAPGHFHDFRFESPDMRTYSLWIDGVPAMEGIFFESLFSGGSVGWGDMSSNRSLAEWDWFQCGIVPEPGTSMCVLATLCVVGLRSRRTR